MTEQAEAFADTAVRHNFALDFTPHSMSALEDTLRVMLRTRFPLALFTGRLDAKRYAPMIPIVGAYVGEVFRRNLGGEWALYDGEPALRFGDDRWVFPLAKADKRFRHGRGDRLDFFYDVMSATVART